MAGDGEGYWPIPAPAMILAPVNGASGVLTSLALTISLAPPVSPIPATGVEIEIRTGPDGSGTLAWSTSAVTGLLSQVVPALTLQAGRSYYIRARFLAASETGAWSGDVMIRT